ncbi:MAG: Na+/H+ antiporter NhaA, partial [Calditrichota bacterium]
MATTAKPRKKVVDGLLEPIQSFIKLEASGGIVLLIAAIIALVWANSPLQASYTEIWNIPVVLGFSGLVIDKPLLLWINDGLMAIFFFVIGLEIKREILFGELSSPKQAVLPIAAAIGGMVIPALFYLAVTGGTPAAGGWGIPMATDIAFALGVLALLGNRVPFALKIFLTALAIVDDLGAILVIALFYTAEVYWSMLLLGGGLLLVLLALN